MIVKASALNLECKFNHGNYAYVGNYYACEIQNINIQTSDNREMTQVIGTHSNGRNNKNVEHISAVSKTIRFLPKRLEVLFPNLKTMRLYACNMEEIRQSDLAPFGKNLEVICFDYNKIKYLEKDLFAKNEKLRYVYFDGNQIKFIHEKVFDNLNFLVTLWMNNNDCTRGVGNLQKDNNRDGVLRIISESKRLCSSGYEAFAVNIGVNSSNNTQNVKNVDENKEVTMIITNSISDKLNELISSTKKIENNCVNEKSKFIQEITNANKESLNEIVKSLNNNDNVLRENRKLKAEIESLKMQAITADRKDDCEFSETTVGNFIIVNIICPKLK